MSFLTKPFKLKAIVERPKAVNQITCVQNKSLFYSRKFLTNSFYMEFAALHFCKGQTILLSCFCFLALLKISHFFSFAKKNIKMGDFDGCRDTRRFGALAPTPIPSPKRGSRGLFLAKLKKIKSKQFGITLAFTFGKSSL